MEKAALRAQVGPGGADADRTLVEAAVAGDGEAFATLYDLHLGRIYRHVYYWVGNQAEAEDLTQQVFLQAWQAIGRYRCGKAPFVAWLLTIAHNLLVSRHRENKGQEPCPLELELASRDRWSDPEVEALARYDRLAVRRAVLRLRPDQQQVVLLRFVEGFAYGEAARCNISIPPTFGMGDTGRLGAASTITGWEDGKYASAVHCGCHRSDRCH